MSTLATLPNAFKRPYKPFQIDVPGWWLVISDLQIPYHDKKAIELAIAESKRQNAVGVLVNGDALDCHELSDFDKSPSAPRYIKERKLGIRFYSYLREQFPGKDIIHKDGNHEERVDRYLIRRAPAFYGIEAFTIPKMLNFDDLGVLYVGQKRVIKMGKLNIIHGHEYTDRQVASPVNPARGLFNKTKVSALAGHHHQTSEHCEPNLNGKLISCWSTGCLCQLTPDWKPLNKWNHGFAMVKLDNSGTYHVRNHRIYKGEIL
jgi:hypothetical protein